MKKKVFLLLFLIVFLGCSKDSDEPANVLEDFTLTLNVDPNYHYNEFTESFRAFLSDENGTILDSGEMQIGQTTTLSFSGDPSAIYDLSYMYYANIDIAGEELYTLITFTNIGQGEYTIGPSPNIENSHDEIYINLKNTGYPCEETSSTPGAGSSGPENGGYYNFRGNLVGSPTSDFYISFKSPNDQFDRYFWQSDIAEGSIFNIDYSALPEIQNVVDVQIPFNSIYGFGLEGLINNDANNIRHSIREGNYPNGITSLSIPIPSNVFDSYLFRLSFGENNFQYYRTMHTDTIPNVVEAPELSFTVNDPSSGNFNMTTTGDAILYNVTFRGANTDETVFVGHSIYGEVAPEVTFSKESLRRNIQQTYTGLTGFETLPLGSVSLTNYCGTHTYKDILRYKIQGNPYEMSVGGFYEGVSKQFD